MSDPLEKFSKELKPCPFCGSEHVRLYLGPGVTFIAGCEEDECGCQTLPFAYHTDAIEAWNRRASDDAR